MTQATVSYKAKVRKMIVDDAGTTRDYIKFKKSIARADCNLRPHQHTYYNSDLFESMLKRAVKEVTGGRDWQYVDALPEAIKVEPGFLATVTITLPQSFIR